MKGALRFLAPVLFLLILASPVLAEPSTADYLTWLDSRRQLWVQEMKRMESHEHGQYKSEYHALSERIAGVRELAESLKTAKGEKEAALRQQLFQDVEQVEAGLEFLLSETPELAEKERPDSLVPR